MKRFYPAVKYLLLLAVAGLFLWVSFRGVKWSDFSEGLKSANFGWIGVSMLVSIIAFYIRSVRWRLIMLPLGKPVKMKDSWDGINIGYLTNFVIPRAGELARCGVITRKSGIPFESVAGTVVLERSIDMLSLIVIFFSVLLFSWDRFGVFLNREIISAVQQKFSISLLWIGGAVILAFGVFLYIIYRYRKNHPLLQKIASIVKRIFEGVISGFKMPDKWIFLLYTVLLWACYWLMSWTTIMAFPAVGKLGGGDALFLMMTGGFGWVIPVQGGIGAYHFIISLALASVYGISQTTGVIFATISHESQALTMIICGLASFVSISLERKRKQYSV
jgi:uncharacterized protein (TIRG00374 family)